MNKKLYIVAGVIYAGGIVLGGPFWFVTIPVMVDQKMRDKGRKFWTQWETGEAA